MCKYNSNYDSEMQKIIIPLMGFKAFHHTNNNNDKQHDLNDFIGRKSILDKLQSWLEDNSERGGEIFWSLFDYGFQGYGKKLIRS